MLVVTRKKDEKLIIGDGIEVQVLRIGRENVRLGIKAPADVAIYREEIYEAIQEREKAAAQAAGSGTPKTSQEPTGAPEPAESTEADATDPPKAKAQSEG